MIWSLTRQLGYRHADDLLRDLTPRELCDWLAVNAADPFVAERADLNAARIGQCCLAAMGSDVPLSEIQLPFGADDPADEDYSDLLVALRERRERREREHDGDADS